MTKLSEKERNDFEEMCASIIQSIKNGEVETKIGDEQDREYYTKLVEENTATLKEMTGLEEFKIEEDKCFKIIMIKWPDSEELKLIRAKNLISSNREEREVKLFGKYGWTYWKTGREVAFAIDRHLEEIEKACGVTELETYSEYNFCGESVFLAIWKLPTNENE